VPSLSGLVGLHVLHRLNAVLLIAGLIALAGLARRDPWLALLASTALRLALLQGAVGALNVLMRLPVEVTALHSALAAMLSLTLVLLVRERVWRGTEAALAREGAPALH